MKYLTISPHPNANLNHRSHDTRATRLTFNNFLESIGKRLDLHELELACRQLLIHHICIFHGRAGAELCEGNALIVIAIGSTDFCPDMHVFHRVA